MPLDVVRCATKAELGEKAAAVGAEAIRRAIGERGEAVVIMATGASQFEMLDALVKAEGIDWSKVTAFHMDEYIGLDSNHGASFVKYLRERFEGRLPSPLRNFHTLSGSDAETIIRTVGPLIAAVSVDVCFGGIGENGHLAFNDPPADFDTTAPYLIVDLDEACRRQQLGEGWFPDLEAVPKKAVSISIRQIMAAKTIVLAVPDQRKAAAVKNTLEGPVTNMVPASILQQHADCHVFIDGASASLLTS